MFLFKTIGIFESWMLKEIREMLLPFNLEMNC